MDFDCLVSLTIIDVSNEEKMARGVIQLNGDPKGRELSVVCTNGGYMSLLGVSSFLGFFIFGTPLLFLIFMNNAEVRK